MTPKEEAGKAVKRPFTFETASDPSSLKALGWPDKTVSEAWRFTVSIMDWKELLVSTHGKILEMYALDGGDDPPDILVKFERGAVGFEMTNLVPEKFAKFDSVVKDVRKTNSTISPSLSGPTFHNRQGMINYALNLDSGWTLTENEVKAWIEEASIKLDKKAIKAGKDTFEYLVMFTDSSHLGDFEAEAVISTLDQKIQGQLISLSLVLYIWINPYYGETWIMRKGRPILYSYKQPAT